MELRKKGMKSMVLKDLRTKRPQDSGDLRTKPFQDKKTCPEVSVHQNLCSNSFSYLIDVWVDRVELPSIGLCRQTAPIPRPLLLIADDL